MHKVKCIEDRYVKVINIKSDNHIASDNNIRVGLQTSNFQLHEKKYRAHGESLKFNDESDLFFSVCDHSLLQYTNNLSDVWKKEGRICLI